MHALGHVGLGFGGATPLVLALGEVGLSDAALPVTAVFVGLSTLPDVDEHLPWTAHRGATHSLPFAVAVGLVVAGTAVVAGPTLVDVTDATALAGLGFAIGAGAVALHVLADVLTPMGVYPLWPVSTERRSLGLARSANVRVNRGLFAVGVGCWIGAVWATLA